MSDQEHPMPEGWQDLTTLSIQSDDGAFSVWIDHDGDLGVSDDSGASYAPMAAVLHLLSRAGYRVTKPGDK